MSTPETTVDGATIPLRVPGQVTRMSPPFHIDKTVRITGDQKRAARRVAPEIVKDYSTLLETDVAKVVEAAIQHPARIGKLVVPPLNEIFEFEFFTMNTVEGIRVTSQRKPWPRYYRLLADK